MKKSIILIIFFTLPVKVFLANGQNKVELINKVKESVVRIHSFSMPTIFVQQNFVTGTGYVADENGLIITNDHVVDKSIGLLVYSTASDKPYYATVLWRDSVLDLAVIKAHDCYLKPLEFAGPDEVHQGDEILIFGYPPGYRDESLKVSWGLVSSDTKDSTIQTTATVNHGNSGGPAINMTGKVIGTVYAKMVELSIEGTGFIRNVKYTSEVLTSAKKLTDTPLGLYGTTNPEAYKKICDAAWLGWKAGGIENISENDTDIESVKNLLLAAIDEDPDYADAYFFLSAWYFNKYLVYCLQGKDPEAKTAREYFIKAYNNAESKKKSLGYDGNSLDQLKNDLSANRINCSNWRDWLLKYQLAAVGRLARMEDINNYLETGATPGLLKESLGGPGMSEKGTPAPQEKNSLWLIRQFGISSPVRLSISFPSKMQSYTKNYGITFGNAGNTYTSRHLLFRHQLSFDLFQYFPDPGSNENYLRCMIFSENLGIQGNFYSKLRFHPKPFVTLGWCPVNIRNHSTTEGDYDQWNLKNGAVNYGVDFDIWLTRNFGISATWENVLLFAKLFPTLYNEQDGLKFSYSKLKIGILF